MTAPATSRIVDGISVGESVTKSDGTPEFGTILKAPASSKIVVGISVGDNVAKSAGDADDGTRVTALGSATNVVGRSVGTDGGRYDGETEDRGENDEAGVGAPSGECGALVGGVVVGSIERKCSEGLSLV